MKIKLRKTDGMFSWYIRSKAGWNCERCHTHYDPPTKALHCSHYWGRGNENTRFDEDNCSAICHGCHAWFHANPQLHREWMLKKLGQKRFDDLSVRSTLYKKRDDYMDLLYIKQLRNQQPNS